jgi:hypothetical protein
LLKIDRDTAVLHPIFCKMIGEFCSRLWYDRENKPFKGKGSGTMQYCPNCRTLQPEGPELCGDCGGAVRLPQPEDMVLMVTDTEYKINELCSALCAQDIAFEEVVQNLHATSPKSMGFRGQASVLVSFENYRRGRGVAKKLGFSFPDAVTVTPIAETADGKEEEEISPTKKKLGKLLLFLSVIAVVAIVVFLSDSVTGFIKGLFA